MDFTNLTKTDKSGKINLQTILPEETDKAILTSLLSHLRFTKFSKICRNNPVVFCGAGSVFMGEKKTLFD